MQRSRWLFEPLSLGGITLAHRYVVYPRRSAVVTGDGATALRGRRDQ
jgi:hypothetical protein